MRYVVGFTQSAGQKPFQIYESETAPPHFAVGSKILADPSAGTWLQITAVAYQLHPDTIVTTVVVSEATSVGGEGDDLVPWPW